MRVAFVTPRYGLEVVGGAELGARMFAERLAATDGWHAAVLTTCALDYRTWANEYPAGSTEVHGVTVHRFPTRRPRLADFDARYRALLAAPEAASDAAAEEWIDAQGPDSPALLDAVAAVDADVIVFYPYLYQPTARGILRAPGPAVMHPAAHDEAPIRLPVFHPVFARADGLVLQTYGEQAFVAERFDVAATAQIVLGLGSDPQPGEAAAARLALGVGDRPYLLCVGRVEGGKGTTTLVELFAAYKARRPGPLQLVLLGPVLDGPPHHPDVIVAGAVDESTKWGALRGALALVNPSGYEAFSLVLVEAWHAGRPVLVNARCLATREHCERSGGGLWFGSYAEFEVEVDRLVAERDLATALGRRGRAYVERSFTWSSIVTRYRAFLAAVAARAG